MYLNTNCIKIPDVLKRMNDVFAAHGYEAYLVGGAVRDMLLKKTATDWDIATNATPQQVSAMFRHVVPTGIAHGTVTVHFLGHQIETTTYRADIGYSDGRHPDRVVYAKTIQDDLSRRDFTMNAIAVNIKDGKIFDPFFGGHDIECALIRAVGNPVERFTEDGLRPIRAIRFSSQLMFNIEEKTFEAIFDPEVKSRMAMISMERFRDELIKMLGSSKPSDGLFRMEKTGIIDIFMPELKACKGWKEIDEGGLCVFDLMSHCFYSCDGAPKDNLAVRLAALVHGIGKPDARKTHISPGMSSMQSVRNMLARMKFSNSTIDRVSRLVLNHMFRYESSWSDAEIRRFVSRVGKDCLNDLFALRLADVYGMQNGVAAADCQALNGVEELKKRIALLIQKSSALEIKDLAINGRDLMRIGIPQGKTMGQILKSLLEKVLDDPEQNKPDTLLASALNLYERLC